MWLNKLFAEEPIDFEKRCRMRIKVGLGVGVLGLLSLGMMAVLGEQEAVFYGSLGAGLMVGGILSAFRNRKYLRDPVLKKQQEVAENDERNRLMGLRCWAYAGYTMFLLLYVGVMISGFVDRRAAMVLLSVTGVYALVLMLFRILLRKAM